MGQDVYTQTAGIHADGDKKNILYANPIYPERFGRTRSYALGKLAGRASISQNLKILGLELSREREVKLLERIKELGEQKKTLTADDLPFLIEDLFGSRNAGTASRLLSIKDATITTRFGGAATAHIAIEYEGRMLEADGEGDGGYDAFMNALSQLTEHLPVKVPRLVDYEVRIPPGGKTDALVEAVVTWENVEGGRNFRTVGVDPDQVTAAVKATEKMLNRLLLSIPLLS